MPNGGQGAEEIFFALKWAQVGPKRGQNEVFGYFHCRNAFVFAHVASHDREQCYLVGSGA